MQEALEIRFFSWVIPDRCVKIVIDWVMNYIGEKKRKVEKFSQRRYYIAQINKH